MNSLRRQAVTDGLCATVTKTKYVYTGGAEDGVTVGLINYPRFPKSPTELWEVGKRIALVLMEDLYQHSLTIEATDRTEWLTRRPQDNRASPPNPDGNQP